MNHAILDQLSDPGIFPGEVDAVEVHQTHLSVVCLAGDRAYKLKKPVKLPFTDFSTLEKRHYFCHEEVRLNRRLCPDVYRGVCPLFRAGDGSVSFVEAASGGWKVIDYAVEMERLPADRMLNDLLDRDAVPAGAIREIAARMAAFHRGAERGAAIDAAGDPANLRAFSKANFQETRNALGTLFDADLHRQLQARTVADFEQLIPALEKRMAGGHIVDGHGDLHARNICLTEPVSIYDCIEFNRGFRCGDTATDNAFLVMDLRYCGHPGLASDYLDAYIDASGDAEQRELMPALTRYRLMVRAKVAVIAAGETELDPEDHREAVDSARRHFHRVAASFVEGDAPLLLIACGLPGSGKTTVFHQLSKQTGWRVFGSDRIRKELAGVPENEPLPASAYSGDFTRKTYTEALMRAASEAQRHGGALVDANFRTRDLRALAGKVAGRSGLRLVLLSFTTPEAVILDRLAARSRDTAGGSDAGFAVYGRLKETFEAPHRSEAGHFLEMDATAPPEDLVPALLLRLLA